MKREIKLSAEVYAKVRRFARKERVSLSRAVEMLFADLDRSGIGKSETVSGCIDVAGGN